MISSSLIRKPPFKRLAPMQSVWIVIDPITLLRA